MSVFGRDAFRMELHAVDWFFFMLKAHDEAVVGLGCDFEGRWQRLEFDDQGMIARHRVRRRDAREDTFVCVRDI